MPSLPHGARPFPRRFVRSRLLSLGALFLFIIVGIAVPQAAAAETGSISSSEGAALSLTLEEAEPAPQAWVTESPRSLRLRFSVPVALEGSSISVTSYRMPHVPGQLTQPGPRELLFTPDLPLEEATYEVFWQARARTGETLAGRYSFTFLVPKEDWSAPLDPRDVNRLLGNRAPAWLLLLPALAGAGGLVWVIWSLYRK